MLSRSTQAQELKFALSRFPTCLREKEQNSGPLLLGLLPRKMCKARAWRSGSAVCTLNRDFSGSSSRGELATCPLPRALLWALFFNKSCNTCARWGGFYPHAYSAGCKPNASPGRAAGRGEARAPGECFLAPGSSGIYCSVPRLALAASSSQLGFPSSGLQLEQRSKGAAFDKGLVLF